MLYEYHLGWTFCLFVRRGPRGEVPELQMNWGNFAPKKDPRPNLLCWAGQRPPRFFMLGRLAVPKTLEIKGRILT